MEMVVRHVLEVTGGMGSGAVVPFQSIKLEHSLDKVTVYIYALLVEAADGRTDEHRHVCG